MWLTKIYELFHHLSSWGDYAPAVIITAGVALLIGCAVGCICSPCEEKDEIFHREVV